MASMHFYKGLPCSKVTQNDLKAHVDCHVAPLLAMTWDALLAIRSHPHVTEKGSLATSFSAVRGGNLRMFK